MRTVLIVALLAGCSSSHRGNDVSDGEGRKLLIDRNWIDRMPENHTDKLHVYRFVPSMGGGVYQDRTLFKGTFELFMFKVERGDHIVFDLPETGEKVTSQFRIEKVDGPAPFDLKLTVFSDPRGPRTYYSMQ